MLRVDGLHHAYGVSTHGEALDCFLRQFNATPVSVFSDFRPGLQDFLSGTPYVGGGVSGPPRAVGDLPAGTREVAPVLRLSSAPSRGCLRACFLRRHTHVR